MNGPSKTPAIFKTPSSLTRRRFLQIAGVTTAVMTLPRLDAYAGPFVKEDFLKLIPLDKKLDPAWVASLTARGEPETFTGEALERIGMPVGGMFAGTLYLGGDGRLWLWDIFNQRRLGLEAHTAEFRGRQLNSVCGSTYVSPLLAGEYRHLEQGFTLTVKTASGEIHRSLDKSKTGFRSVSFTGEYPIGVVCYSDPELPVQVKLEAFSPFMPLNVRDSSLPLTVFSFELKNTGGEEVEVALEGLLENGVFHHHRYLAGKRRRATRDIEGATVVELTATLDEQAAQADRDIVFEDWSKPTFEEAGWAVEGEAFGKGPIARTALPKYMGEVGGDVLSVANSHAGNHLADCAARDAATGKLTSREFTIERKFICFWIGGGSDPSRLGISLLVNGRVVHKATGAKNNRMVKQAFDVSALCGKKARLEIHDGHTEGWGNIGIGGIWFSDIGLLTAEQLKRMPDAGSMSLALLGVPAEIRGADAEGELSVSLTASLGRRIKLAPGASATVDFLISWHFPHVQSLIPGLSPRRHNRQYACDFANAYEVAAYAARNFVRLATETRLWRDTWYDSSLPYWFLNRTFASTSTLATGTCFLFDGGRFYADEGIGCCPGTCTHVWQYAQAPSRLFPEIERNHREFVDFGKALTKDGVVRYRGEHGDWFAIDGHAGRILGVYREQQMTPDGAFLKRVWPAVKKAIQRMITADADEDGILHGPLHNTLDADWTGIVPWVNGMYHAALKAGEIMARENGDEAFANQCASILKRGMTNLDKLCWREEYGYYIQIGDPAKPTEVGAYEGCHIDQVLGQSWAYQVGIGEVITRAHARKCLESLWKFNFTPDVGPFRHVKTLGRWYAMPGEGGLIMLSNPFAPDIQFTGKSAGTQQYFNECMSGFEHQVAAHMMWEKMIIESLAVTRVIHDRYHPRLRNPYNEIECSDHYGRAMASYGTFLAACGYEYDGPKRRLGFAPRLTPEDFKASFTAAEGWGRFGQKLDGSKFTAEVEVKWGKLGLKTLSLTPPGGLKPKSVSAKLAGKSVEVKLVSREGRAEIAFTPEVVVAIGQMLQVVLS